MFNYNELYKNMNDRKMKNLDIFLSCLRNDFIKDIEGTAKIYTRDKELYPYKVVSLKSGRYALIDENKNILFKHDNMHICKVEFIMLTSVANIDNAGIFNKVKNL